ncbi:anti-repressor SinI family protein [Priestia megaterium]
MNKIKNNKKVNQEWIDLMREAYHLGLSCQEVKDFLKGSHHDQKIIEKVNRISDNRV